MAEVNDGGGSSEQALALLCDPRVCEERHFVVLSDWKPPAGCAITQVRPLLNFVEVAGDEVNAVERHLLLLMHHYPEYHHEEGSPMMALDQWTLPHGLPPYKVHHLPTNIDY